MKSAIALGMIGCVGAAHASFDMVLVSDSTNGVIHRYDAETGIYLGNFGSGLLTGCGAIELDQANSTVYCLMDTSASSSNGVVSLNYNTGNVNFYALLSNGFGGGIAVNAAGAHLSLASNNTNAVIRFSSLGSGTGSTIYMSAAADAGNFGAVGLDSTGDVFTVNNVLGRLLRWDAGNTAAPSGTLTSSLFGNTVGMAIRGTELISVRQNGSMLRIPNTQSLTTPAAGQQANFTTVVGAAFGHTTTAYAVGVNGTAKLQRYARSAGGAGTTYEPVGPQMNLSQVGTPGGMAVVVAPEPASMCALLLGAGALIRRRRR